MNIGITTFHRAENYGSVLQAYALTTFLQNNGFKAEILDYYFEEDYAKYDLSLEAIFKKATDIFDRY